MRNLLDNYFLQNPQRIAEHTKFIMSFTVALWNAQHNEPIDEAALHLFLCDETRGGLTEEQKCFVRKCKAEVDQLYLRMLCGQEQESEAIAILPARKGVYASFQELAFVGRFGRFPRDERTSSRLWFCQGVNLHFV